MPHDPRVSYGVAVLLWHKRKLLLLKRQGAHAAGQWACPGGWVDFHEKAAETVVREAWEELGVKVECQHLVAVREEWFEYPQLQSASLYFDAVLLEGEPKIMEPAKCAELRWIDPRDPKTWPKPLFPNLESVLNEIAMDLDDMGDDPTGDL